MSAHTRLKPEKLIFLVGPDIARAQGLHFGDICLTTLEKRRHLTFKCIIDAAISPYPADHESTIVAFNLLPSKHKTYNIVDVVQMLYKSFVSAGYTSRPNHCYWERKKNEMCVLTLRFANICAQIKQI